MADLGEQERKLVVLNEKMFTFFTAFIYQKNKKIPNQLILQQKESRENFSAFLFHATLEGICSKVEYDEPNQAFNGKERKSSPSYTLEPLFKL